MGLLSAGTPGGLLNPEGWLALMKSAAKKGAKKGEANIEHAVKAGSFSGMTLPEALHAENQMLTPRNVYSALNPAGMDTAVAPHIMQGLSHGLMDFMGTFAPASKAQIDAAKALEQKGMSPAEIWKQIRVALHTPDGVPRTEISDQGASLIDDRPFIQQDADEALSRHNLKDYGAKQNELANYTVPHESQNWQPLTQVIHNPELEKHYGGLLSQISYRADPSMLPGNGAFNPVLKRIRLGAGDSPSHVLSTLIHEPQHVIQNEFGMMQGGGPAQVHMIARGAHLAEGKTIKELAHVNQEIKKASYFNVSPTNPKFASLLHDKQALEAKLYMINEWKPYFKPGGTAEENNNLAFSGYARLGGEAEARLAEARRLLSDEQRGDLYPYEPNYFHNATKLVVDKGMPTQTIYDSPIDKLLMLGTKSPYNGLLGKP